MATAPTTHVRTVTIDRAAAERLRRATADGRAVRDMSSVDPADRLPFVRAPEVTEVAEAVIGRFPAFHHLREWRVDYWFDTKLPKPRGGCTAIGKASVDGDLVSARTGYDACVIVNQPWWLNADERRREALVYHELSHFETHVDDAGGSTLRIVKHDLELFVGEAAHFGDWRYGIAEVAEQLQVWRSENPR